MQNLLTLFLLCKVINHQPYDQKADIFSFAIVLWELVTAKVVISNTVTSVCFNKKNYLGHGKYSYENNFHLFLLVLQVPYDTMTPLQAALGVRQVQKSMCIPVA